MKPSVAELMHPWLQTHAGIVPVAELKTFGCSVRDAYRLAASPDFELLMPGILRSTHWPVGRQQLMVAACARSPHVTIGRLTAAHEWRFRGLGRDDGAVHAWIPHGRSLVLPGIEVQRTRRLDAVDIVERDDGVRLTSPSRTLFDCADLLGRKRTASILEQLIDHGKGTFVTHAGTVARLARAGRSGRRTMAAVIASRPAWRAAMQSELELLVLNEIARQQLPAPVPQMWFQLPNGQRIRMDFAWPEHRVDLEVDHPFWHAGAQESHRDKHRDLLLGTVDWYTGRITDLDVRGSLRASIARVGQILALRA